MTAWKRPDGVIAVVLLNQSKEMRRVCIRLLDKAAEFVLYPMSVTTGLIGEGQ